MASASSELQVAIYNALLGDAEVASFVGGRVYDGVPSNSKFPYISFGPSDTLNDHLDGIDASTETIQLDVWSREHGRLRPCKDLCDAVRGALDLAELELVVNAAIVVRVQGVRVFIDADGITAHGVITVEADLETIDG